VNLPVLKGKYRSTQEALGGFGAKAGAFEDANLDDLGEKVQEDTFVDLACQAEGSLGPNPANIMIATRINTKTTQRIISFVLIVDLGCSWATA
jgi:hypothetical protein